MVVRCICRRGNRNGTIGRGNFCLSRFTYVFNRGVEFFLDVKNLSAIDSIGGIFRDTAGTDIGNDFISGIDTICRYGRTIGNR